MAQYSTGAHKFQPPGGEQDRGGGEPEKQRCHSDRSESMEPVRVNGGGTTEGGDESIRASSVPVRCRMPETIDSWSDSAERLPRT
jgi:hypothetical protein